MTEFFQPLQQSPLGQCLVFVLGLVWGSFFNVCIVRIPAERSVWSGRSHCPRCHALIPWHLNIPLISFLLLVGKCRNCKQPISIQYPLVELATALIYLWLYSQYGLGAKFFAYTLFLSILLVISVIDLYHQIIPDELSLGGLGLGFMASFLIRDVSWLDSLLGILLGGGSFFAVSYLYEKFAKREGLGGGDVKLLGMIGAWLGYQSILIVVILSSAMGAIVGIFLMAFNKKDLKTAIPFGPFLALAAVIYLFWGGQIQFWLLPTLP